MKLAARVSRIAPSPTLAMAATANARTVLAPLDKGTFRV